MDMKPLENITIKQLKDLYKLDKESIKDAIPVMQKFRDDNGLTDREALNAFRVSKRIFD